MNHSPFSHHCSSLHHRKQQGKEKRNSISRISDIDIIANPKSKTMYRGSTVPGFTTFTWLFIILTFFLIPHLSHSLSTLPDDTDRKTDSPVTEGSSIKLISSDNSGVTLEVTVSKLKTEAMSLQENRNDCFASSQRRPQADGVRYQVVSYSGSRFTSEVGNPRVPVSRIMLGVPPEATCRVSVLDAIAPKSGDFSYTGYQLEPTPRQIVKTSDNIQNIVDKYEETGVAYRQNALYPRQLATVIYDGYIREQRVISVELHPVQYNPVTMSLKVHSRLVVRVDFDMPNAAPGLSSSSTLSLRGTKQSRSNFDIIAHNESEAFEKFYRARLMNYDNAKYWRKKRPRWRRVVPSDAVPKAPSVGDISGRQVYKIYVEKTGIYRLTYDDLQNWGVEIPPAPFEKGGGIDPRNLHLLLKGQEIPIYVYGEADGRFEEGDYIDFLGSRPDSIYTRWNVYWLIVGNTRGRRVVEMDGAPDDPTGIIVSTFVSKIHFEKDRFYQVLQHVHPEDVSPDDPHAWYQARDHWFWTGIKNSSDLNEVDLPFKLYDITRTLDRPTISVLLSGGTPVQHQILTSINGVKVDFSTWNMQDEIIIQKNLPPDSLIDATEGANILRCARIDTETQENALSYPYHIYINSFDIEYNRHLKAVNDALEFASPPSTDSYEIRKRRKLQYTVRGFLDSGVEIFETDGSVLLAKIRNPQIHEVPLTREENKRILTILEDKYAEEHPAHEFAEEEEPVSAPVVNAEQGGADIVEDITIPDVAYNVTFQYPDSHDARFIATSNQAFLKPARVVVDVDARLKDSSNGADYIVISHPRFMESAQDLGDWRQTSKGGSHRVAVVDITEIYDEFNYGMVSPQAIKDFLKYAYFNWQPPAVSYVVLLGDGTFDFLGIDQKTYPEAPELMGYIPPHYVWTTYGDTSTDHWYTTVSGIDVLPDFFIGRIPVETPESAQAVVDKILMYEGQRPNGPWRRLIISAADDDTSNSGDFIFKKSMEELSQNYTLLGYETTKVYLADIMDMVNANPAAYDNLHPGQVARKILIEEFSKGAVLAQYAGHGGRVVWAHEIMLDAKSVTKKFRETDKLPFLLVLSCYNGYFDKPGTPSMAEELLRLPKSGIIGMLSATRLTYGSGNDALNKIIFDDIFKRNLRGLGEIAFNSKLELLITDGLGQFEVMQQYTLFGDPATRIAMADYEITPQVETPSVKPGGTLRIASGQVSRSTYNAKLGRKQYTPIRDFRGNLVVNAKFPGDFRISDFGFRNSELKNNSKLEVSERVDVVNGRYPAIEFRVPNGAKTGKGTVEYYAENNTEIAVGGAVFTVNIPKFVDIQEEIVSKQSFRIAAQVADDLQMAGIQEVTLEWRNPTDGVWTNTPMTADTSRGEGWYTTTELLPIPSNGLAIRYHIFARDVDNHLVESEQQEFKPLVIPNLRVLNTLENEPLIHYITKEEGGKKRRYIHLEIENTEDVDLTEPVDVYIFAGNPDLNNDSIVDETAMELGHVTVAPNAWQRNSELKNKSEIRNPKDAPLAFQLAPLNINRIAVAELEYTLSVGKHILFAWIDPTFVIASEAKQSHHIREETKTDNLSVRVIEVNEYLVGAGDVQAKSLDGVLKLMVPARSVSENTVLSVNSTDIPRIVNQPSITGIRNSAYQVRAVENLEITQLPNYLNNPAIAEMKFDIIALRQRIKAEIGLGEVPDDALDDVQKLSLQQALEGYAQQMSTYLWHEAARKWVRLDSTLVDDAQKKMLIQAHPAALNTENQGTGVLDDITVDNAKTPEGTWVLLFTADDQYRLLFSPEVVAEGSGQLTEIAPNVDIFQFEPYHDETTGIGITVSRGDEFFTFGDVLRFDTIATTDDGERQVMVSYSYDDNDGNGILQYLTVDENANTPVDKWVILFVDGTHFQLEGQQTGLVRKNGQPLLGEIGEEFSDPNSGLRFTIVAGETPFVPGDRFTFETREMGTIRASTQYLGTFSIMNSTDVIPPDIQFNIGNQNFVDGDPVSHNPQIHALIADDNGIDLLIRKPEFSLSYNDGDFEPIDETEYLLNIQPGSNQATLNYSPTLESGKYELQLIAYDTDGNPSKKSFTFYVRGNLQLLNVMNYPNPFPILSGRGTHITCELTSDVDEIEVKIYTLAGRLIRVLSPGERVGFIMTYWDGRDDDGNEVANGVYYGKITVEKKDQKNLTEYVKMVKLR